MQQPSWMAEAWGEFGQRELAGAAHNPRILAMFDELGHTGHADETAWCAAFVGACLERAGIKSTRSLRARSYLDWGDPIQVPTLGAIAILRRGANPALGHVGFWLGQTEAQVFLLGGNQSNAVTVAPFNRHDLLALRAPDVRSDSPQASTGNHKFEICLHHVLAMEGGWTDDPHDPGGPTNKGITLAVYARERGLDVTAQNLAGLKADLRSIPDDLVRKIYHDRYWMPARCAALRPSLALMHFDASVNHGVGAAARMLQEALGVAVDGAIGPLTLEAARSAEPRHTLGHYAQIRRRRYRALPHFWRFGRGWLRRVDATLQAALHLIPAASPSPSTEETIFMNGPSDSPTTKPHLTDDRKGWWQSMTIWGTLLTAITTVLPMLGMLFGLSITPDLAERIGQDLVHVIQAMGGLIGTLMALFGRVRATAILQVKAPRDAG